MLVPPYVECELNRLGPQRYQIDSYHRVATYTSLARLVAVIWIEQAFHEVVF